MCKGEKKKERLVSSMLLKRQVDKHREFLHRLYRARSVRALRRDITKASHFQLRTLFLVLASVALKKVPANASVETVFFNSRKKRLLNQVVGSQVRAKRFLARSKANEWRRVLLDLAPLLRPALSVLFT